jgi:hypothetical protein
MEGAKALIQSVMEELRGQREAAPGENSPPG